MTTNKIQDYQKDKAGHKNQKNTPLTRANGSNEMTKIDQISQNKKKHRRYVLAFGKRS